eukprot:8265846-Pyramimonas_sp.AAC.1
MLQGTHQEENRLVENMVLGAAEVQVVIQQDLLCKIAAKKTAAVANSDRLSDNIQKRMKLHGGVHGRGAPNLGIDVFAGQRRARIGTHLPSRAGMSFGYYRAEVVGLDGKELHQAQSRFLKT